MGLSALQSISMADGSQWTGTCDVNDVCVCVGGVGYALQSRQRPHDF